MPSLHLLFGTRADLYFLFDCWNIMFRDNDIIINSSSYSHVVTFTSCSFVFLHFYREYFEGTNQSNTFIGFGDEMVAIAIRQMQGGNDPFKDNYIKAVTLQVLQWKDCTGHPDVHVYGRKHIDQSCTKDKNQSLSIIFFFLAFCVNTFVFCLKHIFPQCPPQDLSQQLIMIMRIKFTVRNRHIELSGTASFNKYMDVGITS